MVLEVPTIHIRRDKLKPHPAAYKEPVQKVPQRPKTTPNRIRHSEMRDNGKPTAISPVDLTYARLYTELAITYTLY